MIRKMMVGVCVLMLVFSAGCDRRRVSREANQISAAYEVKMDKGQTTREQDQRFIRAMGKVSLELDSSIRGTKKAEATRAAAIKAAELGVDPNVVPKLDSEQ